MSNSFGTAATEYPYFKGSKLFHNSSSSDKFALVFAIHRTDFVSFKESIKNIVLDETKAINHAVYGKLTHIILEHNLWGAIKGSILGDIVYNTASEADILASCTFQEHTEDETVAKKDVEVENKTATNFVDDETKFDVTLSTGDLSAISGLASKMSLLYAGILDSSVVQAFNDFSAAINALVIDSTKIMSTFKKILELPNMLTSQLNLTNRLALLKQQATAIKTVPINSYNIALFNINCMTYNTGVTSRTAFVSEATLKAAAGIKTVPI
jgi:predicted DNA binding CopG/RHH family protein